MCKEWNGEHFFLPLRRHSAEISSPLSFPSFGRIFQPMRDARGSLSVQNKRSKTSAVHKNRFPCTSVKKKVLAVADRQLGEWIDKKETVKDSCVYCIW